MKRAIVAFIAGIALTSVGTAWAVSTYWKRAGATYVCEGIRAGVSCAVKNTRWEMVITGNKTVIISWRDEPIFGCELPLSDPYETCYDFR